MKGSFQPAHAWALAAGAWTTNSLWFLMHHFPAWLIILAIFNVVLAFGNMVLGIKKGA